MNPKPIKYVICKCGWVSFQVSRKHAENEVNVFNEFYDKSLKEVQDMYGGRSSIRTYERCGFCGTCYHNFRNAKKSEIPFGSTVSPIINKKD